MLAAARAAYKAALWQIIIGARNVEQLRASLDSLKIDMTPELYRQIAALSRTPPPATDRSRNRRSSR